MVISFSEFNHCSVFKGPLNIKINSFPSFAVNGTKLKFINLTSEK